MRLELPTTLDAEFPQHGWALTPEGYRVVVLPILRLFQPLQPYWNRYQELGLAGVWLQSRSPFTTLRMLSGALRDLARNTRSIVDILSEDWIGKPPSEERDERLTAEQSFVEESEVLLIAIFVLLRRLPDQLIDAMRPLLYQDWQSAPRQMKTAIGAAKAGTLSSAKPNCEIDLFSNALLNETAWYESLRNEEGIRDIFIHKDHVFRVSAVGTKDSGQAEIVWRVTGDLSRFSTQNELHIDVLPALRNCLDGMCRFMTQVCHALQVKAGYSRNDMLFVLGSMEDATEFWPTISVGTCGQHLTAQ